MKPPACSSKSRPIPWGLRVPVISAHLCSKRGRPGTPIGRFVRVVVDYYTMRDDVQDDWFPLNATLNVQHRVQRMDVPSIRTAIRCTCRTPYAAHGAGFVPDFSYLSRCCSGWPCPLFSFWGPHMHSCGFFCLLQGCINTSHTRVLF
jgi:hypothetical protein